jgi:hypothetical protein
VDAALRGVTGIHFPFIKVSSCAHRVINYYRLMFQCSPIVIINVSERKSDDKHEQPYDVRNAVERLAETYDLRVIVDGCPKAVDSLILSRGSSVHYMKSMNRDQIELIPELHKLHSFLKQNHLDDAVWAIVGGNPATYNALDHHRAKSKDNEASNDDIVVTVKKFLKRLLAEVFYARHCGIIHSNDSTRAILQIMTERNITKISASALEAMGLSSHDFSKRIFHQLQKNGFFIETANPTVSFIISNNVNNTSEDISSTIEALVKKT